MPTITLLTAAFALGVGVAVFWANPNRFTNRAFSLASLLAAVWFVFVAKAAKAELNWVPGEADDAMLWLRLNGVVAGFIPWTNWLVKESLVATPRDSAAITWRSMPWFLSGVALAVICFARSFVFLDQFGGYQRGLAYLIYWAVISASFLVLIVQICLQMRHQVGIRRIEMQFLALNIGLAGLFCMTVAGLGNVLHDRSLRNTTLPIFAACFGLAAWAITFHRVFDARQVLFSLGQRLAVVGILGIGFFVIVHSFELLFSPIASMVASITLCGSMIFWIDRKSREWLDLDGERAFTELRDDVIEVTHTEPTQEKLIADFEALLCRHCRSALAALLFDRGSSYAGSNGLVLEKASHSCAALCKASWATPESIERQRATPGLAELGKFMAAHSLGLVVAIPRGSPTPSLLLVLGTKTNQWPFTFPEVQRIQTITGLMDNILTRARLTAQAALEAKMEHLAMMSRGLAHDLKNLITPISSFLVHTDGRFEADSTEAEVHGDAKRSVRLMTDYVREALFFSSRLTPRYEAVDVPRVFAAVGEVCAARAIEREVTIALQPSGQQRLTADHVLLQRLLVNLVNNAIDASAPEKKSHYAVSMQLQATCGSRS